MIIINAPLKADAFRQIAESEGLIFLKKAGMKMTFENPQGNDEEAAAKIKKLCKENPQLNTVYFQITKG